MKKNNNMIIKNLFIKKKKTFVSYYEYFNFFLSKIMYMFLIY